MLNYCLKIKVYVIKKKVSKIFINFMKKINFQIIEFDNPIPKMILEQCDTGIDQISTISAASIFFKNNLFYLVFLNF